MYIIGVLVWVKYALHSELWWTVCAWIHVYYKPGLFCNSYSGCSQFICSVRASVNETELIPTQLRNEHLIDAIFTKLLSTEDSTSKEFIPKSWTAQCQTTFDLKLIILMGIIHHGVNLVILKIWNASRCTQTSVNLESQNKFTRQVDTPWSLIKPIIILRILPVSNSYVTLRPSKQKITSK